ncbi:MAG: hypothetical protein ACD_23C00227G0003 [uncultured bacterium]|nr:MAG: hypothetical protein ACD_23C00227G0003 [uncultured bacterium]
MLRIAIVDVVAVLTVSTGVQQTIQKMRSRAPMLDSDSGQLARHPQIDLVNTNIVCVLY